MTDTNSPTPPQGEIEQQIDDILRGRTNSPVCRYVPACGRESDYDYMAADIFALITAQAHEAEARGRRAEIQWANEYVAGYRNAITVDDIERVFKSRLAALQDTTGEGKK